MRYTSMPGKRVTKAVLNLLHNTEKMYGYTLTQQYKQIVRGRVTEGVLYPVLYFLEAEGFLITETTHIGNRVRKYYSLSDKGRERRKQE